MEGLKRDAECTGEGEGVEYSSVEGSSRGNEAPTRTAAP